MATADATKNLARQLDKAVHFHSKDMHKTESVNHTLEALKDLMGGELKNCIASDESELIVGKRGLCPNVIMNERHKMARNRLKPLKTKLFPTPSELKFVSAKKAIRDENSKVLLREKEKRFVAKAIIQLEREFSSRRNSAALSLPGLEKQKKENLHSGIHEVVNKRNVKNKKDPTDFVTSIQKAYEKLHRNIPRSQYCKRVMLRRQVTSTIGSNKNVENLSPITSADKANVRNERNQELEILSPISANGKKDINNEKLQKAEPKLSEIDNCRCGTTDDLPIEGMDVKIPADHCSEKMGNAAEQARKWKMLYYWKVWRKVTMNARKENHKSARIKKIDSFLMRLTKAAEQVQQLEKLANSVSCQSNQKKPTSLPNKREKSFSNSEEIQKLDKIGKEITESAIEAYERLNKSLKVFHPRLKPKLRALSVLSTVKNKYRIDGMDTRRVYPTPAFLTEMENRYKERKSRWENIKKKRLEMEAEKERIMKEREEAEKKMEEMKKREKLEELKEKRRREKEAEEERKREMWLLKQQLKLANDHYIRHLMQKVGFRSWQRLIQLRRNQMESACHHSQIHTCRRYLMNWREFTASQLNQKNKEAQELYEKMLLKKSFHHWMLQYEEYIQKTQVAVDWLEAKLTEKTFVIWFDNTQAERWYFLRKTEFAESFCDRKMQAKCFEKWKGFPELVRIEKEKEKRKKIWQRKVQEFLPDYQPAFISEI